MRHTARRAAAVAVTLAVAMLGLTGCTLPFTTPVAVATIPATQLPAAKSAPSRPLTPSGPAPALTDTGTNWAPMLASLLTYGQWLLANPGAGATGMVANVAAAGCPVTDQLTAEVAGLSGENWRLAPAPLTLSSVGAGAVVPGETTVTLPLQASRAAEPIVDAGGHPASEVAALPPADFDVTLLLGGDGKWRLCSAVPSDPATATGGMSDSDPSLF
jgi:hypothetical protein